MKVLIACYGSRGDVQPYVALGQGLRQAGHQVTLATSVRFREFVEQHGLSYGYMNDDLLGILDTDQGKALVENTTSLWQVIRQTLSMMKQLGPMQTSLLDDNWRVAEQTQPDLIIFHHKAYGCPHFAEKLGVPVMMALPLPMLVPTAEQTNMGFPRLGLGGWYNKLSYRLVNTIFGWSAGKHVRAWRAGHGLTRQKRFDILHNTDGSRLPVLHAVSRHVIAQPADWPASATMNGYWFTQSSADWQPPAELEAFLAAGPAPVYIGFGSMGGKNPQRRAQIVIDALAKSGQRGILATGWGGLRPDKLPETILQIEQAPHDWLLPRVAAAVHHGGAGTTAACLRAGCPSLVVPFFGDQPFWGQRIAELGAGPEPIPQKKLTVENLSEAINQLCSDASMRHKAQQVAGQLAQEDGVAETVALIEQQFAPQSATAA